MLALHSNFGTARHHDQQVRPCVGSYPVSVGELTFWRNHKGSLNRTLMQRSCGYSDHSARSGDTHATIVQY